MPRSFFEK